MNVYHYNASTLVYTHTSTAFVDPKQGTAVLPAYATFTVIPTIPSGQQAKYVVASNTWTLEAIPASSSSSQNPLTNFADMTLEQRLAHYGLEGLAAHILGNTQLAQTATVNAQVASLQATITSLQNQINSINTSAAQVASNQQTIANLTASVNAEGYFVLEQT